MRSLIAAIIALGGLLMPATSALCAGTDADASEGTIFTLWPLIDYRESPGDKFSNLGILGPLIKIQTNKDENILAVRPLFHRTSHEKQGTSAIDYLYPIASSETTPEVSRFQLLQLVQKNNFRKDEAEGGEKDSMFFPIYISGNSEKYGPYTSVFPIYGDLYERFWRDEYHYFLFPLYGSTVKKGTTSRNYLYPFFNTVSGEKESGGHFWPLYGQASKEGVYSKRFVLWPFFIQENTGLNTENPTEKFISFPLYTSTDSPDRTARGYLWPFFGYSDDRKLKEKEIDYLWPLWWTVRGENRHVDSFLPFFSTEKRKESTKNWYLWPLYRNETLTTDTFSRERDRLLFFLYSDSLEKWARDGSERRRTAFWPLFVYTRDPRGVKSLSSPALIEPILDREGIEKNWAPLWRIYQQKWNDSGDSVVSVFWSLYWHEIRANAVAYELFPLLSYRDSSALTDVSMLKGLVSYRSSQGEKSLNFLWLPFGLTWGEKQPAKESAIVKSVGGGS